MPTPDGDYISPFETDEQRKEREECRRKLEAKFMGLFPPPPEKMDLAKIMMGEDR